MTPKVRCAIYTRKSSEEGLDQEFNSLHAQREACEAYILSQKGEGWGAIKTGFDDGGFSGGSMERPALRQLMAEIEAGRIDVVVVYKIDRLTRSLMDFARMVEVFDRRSVSFVSVTQSFNTTTSMGRLTLNVLLSFAQFEREVTGERIRDKIAASKAKGIWMGGIPALGYDVDNRNLVANKVEADLVQRIFTRYLALGTVKALKAELDRDGLRSKAWTTRGGRPMGGRPFSAGGLFHLLKCRLFLGEIVHKGVAYTGRHLPIIDRELFDQVQAKFAANAIERTARPNRGSQAMLKGLLYDAASEPMTPSFGYGKGGKLFRYYIVKSGRRHVSPEIEDAVRRISAPQLEKLVEGRLASVGVDGDVEQCIQRVELRTGAVIIEFAAAELLAQHATTKAALVELGQRLPTDDRLEALDGKSLRIIVGIRPVFRGGRTWLVNAAGATNDGQPHQDRRLVSALKEAHELLRSHNIAPADPQTEWRKACSPTYGYHRKLAALAMLAPDIQQAIVDGRQPPGLSLTHVMERGVPVNWVEQRRRFGFPSLSA
jgi:site-specific DNA recombinase